MISQESHNLEVGSSQGAVHLSLQGKGGVGKSLVASILAQYLAANGHKVRCVDTDPVNKTLSQYKGLQVETLKLLREGGVDQRALDALMERLLTEDGVFVVDNGASTFIPLWNYILENNVHDFREILWRAFENFVASERSEKSLSRPYI